MTAAPAVAKGIRPPELVSPLLAGVCEVDLGEGEAFWESCEPISLSNFSISSSVDICTLYVSTCDGADTLTPWQLKILVKVCSESLINFVNKEF